MNDNERMTKILSDLMLITDPKCLGVIQNTAFNRKKDIRQQNAQVETASWRVDDEVRLLPEHRSRMPYGQKGKIMKINKVRIKVDFPGGCYNVPKLMLMKAE